MYFTLFLTVFVQRTNNQGHFIKDQKFYNRILTFYFFILVRSSEISVFQLVSNVRLKPIYLKADEL